MVPGSKMTRRVRVKKEVRMERKGLFAGLMVLFAITTIVFAALYLVNLGELTAVKRQLTELISKKRLIG